MPRIRESTVVLKKVSNKKALSHNANFNFLPPLKQRERIFLPCLPSQWTWVHVTLQRKQIPQLRLLQ